jgi:hypothetical protein
MRLRSDGSIDPSFGHGGLTTVPSCRWGRTFASLALGPGGEILTAAGTWRRLRRAGPDTLVQEELPVIDRFSASGRLDRGFRRRAIRTVPSPGRGSLTTAERVILWRDRVLVSGQGTSGALVYSRTGRFERTLTPSGLRKPLAGHALGVGVQDGKPVVVTTTKTERGLTVQPLMSAAGRSVGGPARPQNGAGLPDADRSDLRGGLRDLGPRGHAKRAEARHRDAATGSTGRRRRFSAA